MCMGAVLRHREILKLKCRKHLNQNAENTKI